MAKATIWGRRWDLERASPLVTLVYGFRLGSLEYLSAKPGPPMMALPGILSDLTQDQRYLLHLEGLVHPSDPDWSSSLAGAAVAGWRAALSPHGRAGPAMEGEKVRRVWAAHLSECRAELPSSFVEPLLAHYDDFTWGVYVSVYWGKVAMNTPTFIEEHHALWDEIRTE